MGRREGGTGVWGNKNKTLLLPRTQFSPTLPLASQRPLIHHSIAVIFSVLLHRNSLLQPNIMLKHHALTLSSVSTYHLYYLL